MLDQTITMLQRSGFTAQLFHTAAEAKEAALAIIPEDAAVGIGGSVTIQSMGLRESLMARGNAVHWHWYPQGQDVNTVRKAAGDAPYYLTSANAITKEGDLIAIDGFGNRVTAMLSPFNTVILIVGRNKLTNDPLDAVKRIKSVACPQNARRLNLKTPCATGTCTDCRSPQRMCNATIRITNPPAGKGFYVFLVDEDLGY